MLHFMGFSSASIVLCECCRADSEAGQGIDDGTFIQLAGSHGLLYQQIYLLLLMGRRLALIARD